LLSETVKLIRSEKDTDQNLENGKGIIKGQNRAEATAAWDTLRKEPLCLRERWDSYRTDMAFTAEGRRKRRSCKKVDYLKTHMWIF
jgi:hypothetical protein